MFFRSSIPTLCQHPLRLFLELKIPCISDLIFPFLLDLHNYVYLKAWKSFCCRRQSLAFPVGPLWFESFCHQELSPEPHIKIKPPAFSCVTLAGGGSHAWSFASAVPLSDSLTWRMSAGARAGSAPNNMWHSSTLFHSGLWSLGVPMAGCWSKGWTEFLKQGSAERFKTKYQISTAEIVLEQSSVGTLKHLSTHLRYCSTAVERHYD